jgi:O-antigen biosynthesis protein
MRVLIIGYVWPEPNSSAAGSRMLDLINLWVAQGWELVFASAAALSEHRADLPSLGVREQSILLNCDSFDAFVVAYQPQLVLFDRFFTEEQFGWRVEKNCPHALRILDTEDLHSLREARQQLLKATQKNQASESLRQSVGPVLATSAQLYSCMSSSDIAQREIAAIFRCDLSLMISTYEIALLQQYFAVPAQLLFYLPLLAGAEVNAQALRSFTERAHFIAIGNFRHQPNWDAVLWLKHQLWPLIRAHLPKAELHIYGAYPPPKATQLHNAQDGFLVKGWAPSAREVMCAARVCLAPLRFGAGLKGKLMDAMHAGTPSVTTALGAEAMAGDMPWGGAIANSAQDFCAAALALYEHQPQWQVAQQQGVAILQQRFKRAEFTPALQARLAQLQQQLAAERQQNFIGQMLRHHAHKSTQYMGQWIAEKNK